LLFVFVVFIFIFILDLGGTGGEPPLGDRLIGETLPGEIEGGGCNRLLLVLLLLLFTDLSGGEIFGGVTEGEFKGDRLYIGVVFPDRCVGLFDCGGTRGGFFILAAGTWSGEHGVDVVDVVGGDVGGGDNDVGDDNADFDLNSSCNWSLRGDFITVGIDMSGAVAVFFISSLSLLSFLINLFNVNPLFLVLSSSFSFDGLVGGLIELKGKTITPLVDDFLVWSILLLLLLCLSIINL